ncbi:MAG: methyl-accepting chemotaxis protein [Spirochaetales bacterium]|nr:methyl-accepting chemotaxis protein [Spirochaetales bacterium]
MKLTAKILLPVVLMLTAAVTIVSLIGYSNIADEVDNVMRISTESTLEDILVQVETFQENEVALKDSLNTNFLRITRTVAAAVSGNPELKNGDALSALAGQIGVEEIHVINNQGVLYTGSIPDFYGFDFSTNEQTKPFLDILSNPELELAQEPQKRAVDGALFQYVGVALPDGTGLVQIGVLPTELEELLERSGIQKILDNYPFKNDSYAYVIDVETNYSTHHTFHDRILTDMNQFDFAKRFQDEYEGSFRYVYDDVEVFTSFQTTENGIFVVAVPTENYRKTLIPILIALISSSFISLVLLMAVMFFIVRRTVKPLKIISRSLYEISSGEADLTRRLEVTGKDEISDVAMNFNSFMENLQSLIRDIQTAVVETGNLNVELSRNTETSFESAENIKGYILSVQQQLELLNRNIAESATAMEEISSNTQSFDTIISSQAAMVEESTASITQMIASLNNVSGITSAKKESTAALNHTASEGKSQINLTSAEFKTVEEKIVRIQEMASAINNIASQTNLLSMNAAIEAAHAGDAGKGFAVVAEEIRKLAETSSSSSASISNMIKEITEAVNSTSGSVSSTLTTFDAISREVESTVDAFHEIEDSVSELSIGGKQIMESTEEINNVTMEVRNGSSEIHNGIDTSNKSLMTIRENSVEVAGGIEEINKRAAEVISYMERLQETGSALNRITEDLSRKFNQFKTE